MGNKNNEKKSVGIIIMSFVIIAFVICYTKVTNADNMGELESKKQENSQNQSQMEQQASNLQESKGTLENVVSDLNDQLSNINQKISDLDSQINEKESQISQVKTELDAAKTLEQKQYKDMKLRIKFMFEMGDESYFDIILSGDNIADSLNKAEYISELVKYDRAQLKKYNDNKVAIEEKESTYVSQQQELVALKKEADEQRQLISNKISDSKNQIAQYSASIAEAESKALEYEKQFEENNRAMLEESRRIEESSVAAAMKNDSESGHISEQDTFVATDSDIDMLAALIQAEAENQPYEGKLCVGAVVVNRINSPRYGMTMTEVLYQPYAFTPVTVGTRFATILARGANESCYQAAREVLIDKHILGDWLYFKVNDGSVPNGYVIGDHVFYTVWTG